MISIINKVDLKPLNEELYARPKPASYLIMSAKTRYAIYNADYEENGNNCCEAGGDPEGPRFTYRGIPIATCNAVPFGYIDIKD